MTRRLSATTLLALAGATIVSCATPSIARAQACVVTFEDSDVPSVRVGAPAGHGFSVQVREARGRVELPQTLDGEALVHVDAPLRFDATIPWHQQRFALAHDVVVAGGLLRLRADEGWVVEAPTGDARGVHAAVLGQDLRLVPVDLPCDAVGAPVQRAEASLTAGRDEVEVVARDRVLPLSASAGGRPRVFLASTDPVVRVPLYPVDRHGRWIEVAATGTAGSELRGWTHEDALSAPATTGDGWGDRSYGGGIQFRAGAADCTPPTPDEWNAPAELAPGVAVFDDADVVSPWATVTRSLRARVFMRPGARRAAVAWLDVSMAQQPDCFRFSWVDVEEAGLGRVARGGLEVRAGGMDAPGHPARVVSVAQGSIFARVGLREGDLIVSVALPHAERAAADLSPSALRDWIGWGATLTVRRAARTLRVVIPHARGCPEAPDDVPHYCEAW